LPGRGGDERESVRGNSSRWGAAGEETVEETFERDEVDEEAEEFVEKAKKKKRRRRNAQRDSGRKLLY
jgi:hypothetical protein